MSLEIGEKIRQIREAEGMSREAFSEATTIPVGTLRGVEGGQHEPSYPVLEKIAGHERLNKYTLWLLSGKTSPLAGQVAPGQTAKLGAGAALDTELLELVIGTVEQILTDKKRNLPPDKKSKLIAYLYEQYSQEEEIQIDRPKVVRLIDFAA